MDNIFLFVNKTAKTSKCFASDLWFAKLKFTNKSFGFTLSEVLITLSIVGIVAALTMPQLVNNYKKKETASAVKRAYSEISQVVKFAEAENGEMASWNYPEANSIEENQKFIENYIIKYYKGVTYLENGKNPEGWNGVISRTAINFVSANGTTFSMKPINKKIVLLIDINGFKKPNKMGTDMFYFEILSKNGKLQPYGWRDGLTREMILNGYEDESSILACKQSSEETDESDVKIYVRHACTALLMIDGWEFKKDYPWLSTRSGPWN